MPEALSPTNGWGVLHLFCTPLPDVDREAVVAAVKALEADDHQVVTRRHARPQGRRRLHGARPRPVAAAPLPDRAAAAGLDVVDSYVSLTELSEYAQGVPDELKQARLYPQLPPEGKPAFCFYPMSKRAGRRARTGSRCPTTSARS